MTSRDYRLGVVLAAAVMSAAPSCGGRSNEPERSSGAAGTDAGHGMVANAGSGASSLGGTGGVAPPPGSAGNMVTPGAGSGSLGGSPAEGGNAWGGSGPLLDCPPSAPEDAADCRGNFSDFCSYDGAQCLCGEPAVWGCAACPEEPPSGACEPGSDPDPDRPCHYEGLICACTERGAWACLTGPRLLHEACPAEQPEDRADCESAWATGCRYDGVQCNCGRVNRWQCTSCPGNQPEQGASCDPSEQAVPRPCSYGERNCVCGESGWTCAQVMAGAGNF